MCAAPPPARRMELSAGLRRLSAACDDQIAPSSMAISTSPEPQAPSERALPTQSQAPNSPRHSGHFPPESLRGHAERALVEAGGPQVPQARTDQNSQQGVGS